MSHPSPLVSPGSAAPPGPPAVDLVERALSRAAELVAGLSREQLVELAAGRADLVYRAVPTLVPSPAPPPSPIRGRSRSTGVPPAVDDPGPTRRSFDVEAAVDAINALSTREEVAGWLAARDRELTVPVLREVARRLGPTVCATASSKAGLQRNIVEGTAGFRERSHSMSGGGAWRR